ncbi:MAG TPA: hypothetical protein VIM69_02050 [Opitutaceae bacterium]
MSPALRGAPLENAFGVPRWSFVFHLRIWSDGPLEAPTEDQPKV